MPNIHHADEVMRTDTLFADALTPMAVYIDQIGKFEVSGQTFVPRCRGHKLVYSDLTDVNNPVRSGFMCFLDGDEIPPDFVDLQRTGANGGRMFGSVAGHNLAAAVNAGIITQVGDGFSFTQGFLEDPNSYQYFGLIEFRELRPSVPVPPIHEIAERYAGLRGRVDKKLKDAFVQLNLERGLGYESLIVYSREIRDGVYDTWSPRDIKPDSMILGSVLKLGRNCPFGDINNAHVMSVTETGGAMQTLANILTKRLK